MKQMSQLIRPIRHVKLRGVQILAILCFGFALASIVRFTPAWTLAELHTFDYLSTAGAPVLPEEAPVIVAIDEPSLADINQQWPWPRTLYAELIRQLRGAGAKVIGIDVIFAEPSNPPADDALTSAMGPDIVLAADETLIKTPQADQLIRTMPLPALLDAGARAGTASLELGPDGVVRAMPTFEDTFADALAIAAGRGASPQNGTLLQSLGPARSFPTVSFYQALDPARFLPPGTFKDRVVLVGLSLQNAPKIDRGGADAFATSHTIHSGELTSGVEIQASIYTNLIGGLAIQRIAGPIPQILLLLAVALGAAAVWRRTAALTLLYVLIAFAAFTALSFLAMYYGRFFLSPLGPSLAFSAVVTGQAMLDFADERRKKQEITRAFSQYMSPELVKRLISDPSQLRLGGERRMLTVLFSDVRGFTTIAESMKDDPERLTMLINRLLTPLSDIVMDHGGTIDKFMGDCIMAFWNAPMDDAEHATHAVEAALKMQMAMIKLNEELRQEAKEGLVLPFLKMGVGINTGECVVGNMGSTRRFDYSCLGDPVNLASRLEGESKNYGVAILIGEETAHRIADRWIVVELNRVTVKGRLDPSPVFTVLDDATSAALDRHRGFLQRFYEGSIQVNDPLFDDMAALIPSLAAYYRLMEERIARRPTLSASSAA